MSSMYVNVAPGANYYLPNVATGDLALYAQSNSQKILFGASNTTTVVPALSITGSNIGINKGAPSFAIDVYDQANVLGTSSNALMATHANSNNAISASFFAPNLQSNIATCFTGINIGKDNGNYNGWLLSHTHQGESTASNYFGIGPNGGSTALAITGGSNVGINTTTPGYTLDVNGTCRVSTYSPFAANRPYIRGCFYPSSTGYLTLESYYASGGMTVTSSTQLVAPIAGVYQVGFNTLMATSTGRVDVYIYLNGGFLNYTLNEDNGTGYHYRNISVPIYMSANDYIRFYTAGTVYGGAGAGTYDPQRTYWFYLIG